MNIKTLILIIINSLIALVIALLSFSSYKQFSNVLNDRILLQLNSIKTLKQNQIENLLKSEWERFEASELYSQNIDTTVLKLPDSIKNNNGIYDFTRYHVDKKTTIGFISNSKRGTAGTPLPLIRTIWISSPPPAPQALPSAKIRQPTPL